MRDDFLIFGAPHIGDEEIAEVVDTLRSGWLGTGPKVAQFERDFAAYQGLAPEQVVALNSCTAGLHLSLLAADVAGGEVITTPMTFCATANAIVHAGATPVLVDIDPATLNIDVAGCASAINERTRAILPVHFAGQPADIAGLCKLAEAHGLRLIEDCAHAIESTVDGRHCGTFGDFGCFSFYVTKNVVCGEGGMVVGRDPESLARIRRMSLHGMSLDASQRFGPAGYRHYAVTEAGFKYNMMDLQAAIGLHQLARIDGNLARREAIWQRYSDAFSDLPLTLPPAPVPGTVHARHLYTIRVGREHAGITRDAMIDALREHRIGVGVHYLSLPEHPYYQQAFGWDPDRFPVARDVGRSTLSLPLSPRLSDADVASVIAAVRDVVAAAAPAALA